MSANESGLTLCIDCGGAGWLRLDVPPGHPHFGKPVRCSNPVHNEDRLNRLVALSQLKPSDKQYRLNQIQRVPGNIAMLDAAAGFVENPRGFLYIWGPPGNAKTIVLKAICNELALAGVAPVVYIKFTRLVDLMRDAYAEQKARADVAPGDWQQMGYIDRFERLKQIRVLAIEEFDKESLTNFVQKFRFDFLDDRYEQAVAEPPLTATVFASNSSPLELPDMLRSRISDGRNVVVENKAGDARPMMRW